MGLLRLVDLIKNWNFIKKFFWKYDQIVSDYDFWNEIKFVKINNFWDFWNLNKKNKTIFILDKLLIENIEEFFDMKDFCVLDFNFWLSSFSQKIWISKFDLVWFVYKNIDLYEPADLFSFEKILEIKWNKIIRLNNFDVEEKFIKKKDYNDLFSLEEFGFLWEDFSLITTGCMLPEIVRLGHLLNENWNFMDIFVLNKLNFTFDKELFKNKNILFVLDIYNQKGYENYLKQMFVWFNIKFIYPKYDNLKTVMDEYKLENLAFDANWIFNRISSRGIK